ncbi:MAG: cupin domain-containing protein [Nocardioides sp.]
MRVPGHPTHFRDVPAETADGVATHRVHADPGGSGLELSVLAVDAGRTVTSRVAGGVDELLYVISGTGELQTSTGRHLVGTDTSALANGGDDYTLTAAETSALEVVVVTGRTDSRVACRPPVPVVDLTGQEKEAAVSGREFRVLFDPDRGCSGMTQFVGYVPAIRTPRHYHPYDEMLFIVRGEGTVEIEGREVGVGPGHCYYLPAGCVHLVQNTQDRFLIELGVFCPAGSPAQNTPVE